MTAGYIVVVCSHFEGLCCRTESPSAAEIVDFVEIVVVEVVAAVVAVAVVAVAVVFEVAVVFVAVASAAVVVFLFVGSVAVASLTLQFSPSNIPTLRDTIPVTFHTNTPILAYPVEGSS